MGDTMTSIEARLIESSLSQMRAELTRQGDTLVGINESLRTLTRVEEAQVHIKDRLSEGSKKLTDHEQRLVAIEQQMPGLKEMRRWVIGGILAGVGMIGTALVKLVLLP